MSDANSARGTTQAQPESNVTTVVNGFGQVPSGTATYGPIPGSGRDESFAGAGQSARDKSESGDSPVSGSNGKAPLDAPVRGEPAPKPQKLTWREKLGLSKKEVDAAPGPAAMRLADAQHQGPVRDGDQPPVAQPLITPPPFAQPSGQAGWGSAALTSEAPQGLSPATTASVSSKSSPPPVVPTVRPTAQQSASVFAPMVPPPSISVADRSDNLSSPGARGATDGPSTSVIPAVVVPPVGSGTLPDEPALVASPRPRTGAPRRTRKARLRLSRLDPWSVMKTSFMFSIAAGIMLVVAVYVVWTVLGTSGLFDSVNGVVADVLSAPNDTTPFRIQDYVNTQKVMGVSALIACVDVVIFTALATLASFLYNLAATMLGGLEITLAED